MFDLYNDVIEICREASLVCTINFNKVLKIVNGKGALLAIKEIIRSEEDIEGLEELLKIERKDLTIESLVLDNRYKEEFTDEDREFAKMKLSKYEGNNIKD